MTTFVLTGATAAMDKDVVGKAKGSKDVVKIAASVVVKLVVIVDILLWINLIFSKISCCFRFNPSMVYIKANQLV